MAAQSVVGLRTALLEKIAVLVVVDLFVVPLLFYLVVFTCVKKPTFVQVEFPELCYEWLHN